MNNLHSAVARFHHREEGHAMPAVASLIGAVGAVLLGIGAANDSGALAIAGGVVAGLGFLAGSVLEHVKVDYNIFGRLEDLEKK